jgi:hypothetical protein
VIKRICFLFLLVISNSAFADPCQSGLQPGQRPGPYAFLVAVGQQRGQAHCFICETADRPAVIVFARSTNDQLGKLLTQLDKAVIHNKKAELRSWVTFLSDSQPTMEPKVIEFARKYGLSQIAMGIFEDMSGPPSYRINKDADVTVLLAVNQKVAANFAFRTGELTDEKMKEIVAALPKIVEKK